MDIMPFGKSTRPNENMVLQYESASYLSSAYMCVSVCVCVFKEYRDMRIFFHASEYLAI